MILVSNHLLRLHSIDIKPDNIIRINIAWVKDGDEFEKYLNIPYSVFVDYPYRRRKPPTATLSLDEIIGIMSNHNNVKFFAISNAEDENRIRSIRQMLPSHISIVPKIETKYGVENVEKIAKAGLSSHIMLDKEDLYIDVNSDGNAYSELIEKLTKQCKEIGIKIFGLSGVIFDDGHK